MKVSLVTLVLSFILGVTIGILHTHASIVIIFLSLIAIVQALLYVFAHLSKKEHKLVGFIFWISVFSALGIFRGEMYEEISLPKEFTQGKQTFVAEIISIPEAGESTQSFDVSLASSSNMHLRITAPLYPTYVAGEVVEVRGSVKEPEILLPIDTETISTSFDYKRYLHSKGIAGTMVFPSIKKLNMKEETLMYTLFAIKQKSESILSSRIPSPESALANGVLLGSDTLPKENKDEIRIASLSHITVLSGFNVAIIVTVVLLLLRFLPLFLRVVISTLLITGFVIAVGGGASLIRATVMTYVGLLALLLGRRYDAITALFFALFVYICFSPEAVLYDVSLQLSFLATFGIITLYEHIENFISKYLPYESIVSVLATTLSVMMYTTPFLMYTFGTFSLYGIVANILALPLVPLLMGSSFLLLCTSFIPAVSHVFAFVSYILTSAILCIAKGISSLPYASVSLSMSLSMMTISYMGILLLTWYIQYKKSEIKMRVSDSDSSIVYF